MSKYWLGQLRHAYKNAYDGAVKQHVEFADHLLAPAIAEAEKYVTETDQELERLRKIEAAASKLYKVLKGTCAAMGPSGLALKEALGEK